MNEAVMALGEPGGRVLVVDDEPMNRELLRELLEANGYVVEEAEDGAAALEKVAGGAACDVILMDVMMPRMNGLEACQALKGDPRTSHIPVLIVSALAERSQRLEGIEAGANDYLTKPIDLHDLTLRVRNAVLAKRLGDQVRQDMKALQELEALRDSLTHMVVHDMRSPLMTIMGSLEMIKPELEAREGARAFWDLGQSATQELIGMCNALLDVSRLEDGKMPVTPEPCLLHALAEDAARSLETQASVSRVTLAVSGDTALTVPADPALLRRVVVNLLGNAIKYSPQNGTVAVRISVAGSEARVEVVDTGVGIPARYHQRIFEKFVQVEARRQGVRHSSGLGLAFCKLAIEAHKGHIGVESEPGRGSCFWFTLPLS